MQKKIIVTCAVTGAGDTARKSPHVPVTPEQIAQSAIDAAKAGATIAHIHVRDPKTGGISHDPALFQEVVERVRESETDVILNLTSGGGGDWIPSENNPSLGGPGTDMQTPEERHEPIGKLLPELCTLDCGSMNFGDQLYISTTDWLRRQARLIQQSGVKPELECFDTGHLRFANQLIDEGLIDGDPMFQFCLGIPWGANADAETMIYMRNQLPKNAHWSAFGIGRMQLPMAIQSMLLGGHIRVGLEDNLYLDKGMLATNAQLVDRAITIMAGLGAQPMTPEEARKHLGLKNPHRKALI
ncbi:3-keto-5-aminohexanoate cleavage protein [Neobacillus rhizophilus]|uniref:3-keto-5-aminohexanoate cleavage protein n=1 Tax=Neobacillus rhizophilus TaxID=2833579 RepID=A0A942YWP7_9BACI|nr:3-keto-5-aminohexanoate cleavage protein [Neobacillus rhizophilus]MBS4212911.1 3-keto-5-aminohexanoate cleavage protein [Neobacillus rhizophilus]